MDSRDKALAELAALPEVRSHLAVPNTGVYIVRPDGMIVWASPSMKEVTGRGPDELVGRNGWDVFVPNEVLAKVAEFRAQLSSSDGTLWMPLRMPGDQRQWTRVDTMLRGGAIICAFRREAQPELQRVHYHMRPRPRAA